MHLVALFSEDVLLTVQLGFEMYFRGAFKLRNQKVFMIYNGIRIPGG